MCVYEYQRERMELFVSESNGFLNERRHPEPPYIPDKIASLSIRHMLQVLRVLDGTRKEYWESIIPALMDRTFLRHPRRLVHQRSR